MSSYVHGLSWVLTYYHDGCGSWTWYYPYLYAPLASDLRDLNLIKLEFQQGTIELFDTITSAYMFYLLDSIYYYIFYKCQRYSHQNSIFCRSDLLESIIICEFYFHSTFTCTYNLSICYFLSGKPFTPLLQLLAVLPPQSGKFLPVSYEERMTRKSSPLYPFYPKGIVS